MSDTLSAELSSYRIGPRIKSLRTKKQMGLVQLGEHSGLSTAMLSKIERGQLFPTLPTLLRIALVFGVGLDFFFDRTGPRIAITRKNERLRLPIPAGAPSAAYFFESLDYPLPDRRMDAFLAEFPAGGSPSEAHQHGAEELIYVLEGALNVTVEGQLTTLAAGDAMTFGSSVPHSYQSADKRRCTAIIVAVP
ncbi:MAG TPA: cupin domain-containing protein [Hyphomicrobium sp.]|nr:cupin domain-containing protein [Hyphomicrobium sp.]